MDVHAVAGLEQERLGHERDVEAMPLGAQTHDVLEQHGVVGHLHHRPVADIDLGLARAVLHIAGLDLDVGLAQALADVEHERLHLPPAVDGVGADVVVDRLPVGGEGVKLQLGGGIDAVAHLRRTGELALEHGARVHLDRSAIGVERVAQHHTHAVGPPGDAEAGEVGDGVHVRHALTDGRPGGVEDAARRIPGVDDIGDREARPAQELPDRHALAARDPPGVDEDAFDGVDAVLLAQGRDPIALRRVPGVQCHAGILRSCSPVRQ